MFVRLSCSSLHYFIDNDDLSRIDRDQTSSLQELRIHPPVGLNVTNVITVLTKIYITESINCIITN